ncbi:MAG: tagaturonate epimerase family protein [Planctomycetaceae bacterium]
MQRDGGGIQPIFPQQSIREMSRTQRTAEQVMREALAGAAAAGWSGVTGAAAVCT